MRTKRVAYNTISRLIQSVVVAVAGLIIPRLVLSHFGSDYYGVITSINQFMGYIAVLTMGVYSVTQTALYKPLTEKDIYSVSRIIRASEIFMRKIALIFAVVVVIFAISYPLIVINDFEWSFTFVLVFILGIGPFFQYYLWISYCAVLEADQRGYIVIFAQICVLLINTAIVSYMIISGYIIQTVYLMSSFILIIPSFFIYFYTRQHYKLIKLIEPDVSAIKQRWDAFAHQLSIFVRMNMDIIIVTIFLGVFEVSVYAVYFFVLKNISIIVASFISPGVTAAFGNMLARNEEKNVRDSLRFYEFIVNSLATLLYTCAALLIVQFVSVYTAGVYDVNYYRPIFAYLVCISQFSQILRKPYESVVYAAGCFKQTRNGAIVEALVQVVISLSLVYFLGLVGVAIGALCAAIFRTVQYAFYVSQNIVVRSVWIAIKKFFLSIVTAVIIIVSTRYLPEMTDISYSAWILHALPVFGIAVGVTLLVAVIFYREETIMLIKGLLKIVNNKASVKTP